MNSVQARQPPLFVAEYLMDGFVGRISLECNYVVEVSVIIEHATKTIGRKAAGDPTRD